MILVDIPEKKCMEWIVVGDYPKRELVNKIIEAGFQEGKDGYFQTYEDNRFVLKGNGEFSDKSQLYYCTFDGSIEFGKVIIDYLCQQLRLTKKCFRVFVPIKQSRSTMERKLIRAGFEIQECSQAAVRMKGKNVSITLIEDGYYLQIRGQHERDWERLFKQLLHYEEKLKRTYKRKMKVS